MTEEVAVLVENMGHHFFCEEPFRLLKFISLAIASFDEQNSRGTERFLHCQKRISTLPEAEKASLLERSVRSFWENIE